jgi:CheY-like chemotaxis protein
MSKRILAVDDEPNIRLLMEMALGERGYAVSSVADGRQCMMAVGKEVPDLILLDLFMPGMGGIEVVSHLRHLPATRDVPILIITGSVEAEDLPVLDMVQGYLVKPFRLTSLVSAVERVLGQSREAFGRV